jgi:hypothetical protein
MSGSVGCCFVGWAAQGRAGQGCNSLVDDDDDDDGVTNGGAETE